MSKWRNWNVPLTWPYVGPDGWWALQLPRLLLKFLKSRSPLWKKTKMDHEKPWKNRAFGFQIRVGTCQAELKITTFRLCGGNDYNSVALKVNMTLLTLSGVPYNKSVSQNCYKCKCYKQRLNLDQDFNCNYVFGLFNCSKLNLISMISSMMIWIRTELCRKSLTCLNYFQT